MNITFFVVLVVLIGGGLKGYKKGIVEEIGAILGLIAASAVIGLIVVAVKGYFEGETIRIVIGVICLFCVLIIYHIVETVLGAIRAVFKIPLVSGLDRCLGFAFGMIEMMLFIQLLFIILTAFEFGGLNQIIVQQVYSNEFLSFLYKNNYVAKVISMLIPISK